MLANLVRQDDLNRILLENRGLRNWQFAAGVLRSMNVGIEVEGMDNIPETGRFVFASNHPLGGLDGIALIALLGKRFNGKVKCIVNDVLMMVEPLGGVFLPINKYGSQSKVAINNIDKAYEGDDQIIMFPAGYCSRLNSDGKVRDLVWNKSFVTKSIATRRDVIPIYFDGLNSKSFYRIEKIRKSLGIKLSIGTILLPKEMVGSSGKTFKIKIGKPIPFATFDRSRSQKEWAQEVKEVVYGMASD